VSSARSGSVGPGGPGSSRPSAFFARSRTPNAESRLQHGFTLIEMMAVLVLIGVVMAIVGGKVWQNFQSAQYKAGIAQVHSLEMKIQSYALDNGSAPQNLNDLVNRPGNASNWNGPYAKPADIKDPFGHPFLYKSPGDHGDFDIVFYGKDGAPGGDGLNKDMGNWE
jgi:general secretion pathway protein G